MNNITITAKQAADIVKRFAAIIVLEDEREQVFKEMADCVGKPYEACRRHRRQLQVKQERHAGVLQRRRDEFGFATYEQLAKAAGYEGKIWEQFANWNWQQKTTGPRGDFNACQAC